MNNYLKFGAVLFIVVAVSCGLLALVNKQTSPVIEENIKNTQDIARKEVIPAAQTFTPITLQPIDNEQEDTFTYYEAYDVNGDLIGYTFIAEQYGYSSIIQVMVGVDTDFTIMNIKIISQAETPGLGSKIQKPEFMNLFAGLKVLDLKINREGGEITNITGATISTKAVTNAIKSGLEKLESAITGGENDINE